MIQTDVDSRGRTTVAVTTGVRHLDGCNRKLTRVSGFVPEQEAENNN